MTVRRSLRTRRAKERRKKPEPRRANDARGAWVGQTPVPCVAPRCPKCQSYLVTRYRTIETIRRHPTMDITYTTHKRARLVCLSCKIVVVIQKLSPADLGE